MDGWIKLHRKLIKWGWYNDSKMVHLFIHLILKANHAPKNWKGITINTGQAIIGLKSVSEKTGISIQSLRTCTRKLKRTGEILLKSTNRFTIITICNYKDYQIEEIKANKQLTNNQQTTNKQLTTNKKVKNYKNVKNKETSMFSGEKYFNKIWDLYPSKDGKKAAYRHYHASVKTSYDFSRINIALDNYLKSKYVLKGFIKNGSTWFNNWEDWVNYKPDEKSPEMNRRDEAIEKDRANLAKMKKDKADPETAKNKFKEIKGLLKKTTKKIGDIK